MPDQAGSDNGAGPSAPQRQVSQGPDGRGDVERGAEGAVIAGPDGVPAADVPTAAAEGAGRDVPGQVQRMTADACGVPGPFGKNDAAPSAVTDTDRARSVSTQSDQFREPGTVDIHGRVANDTVDAGSTAPDSQAEVSDTAFTGAVADRARDGLGLAGTERGFGAAGTGEAPAGLTAQPPLRGLPIWNLHPLNARLGLTGILGDVRAAAREAVALAAGHAPVPDFDLIVRGQPGAGIAEWGLGGCAPMPGVIEITIDPPRYAHARFVRTLIHEIHHLIRWDGPGYGHSLGEALVSEGLAGHFVLQVLGGPPDPWDATVPSSSALRQAMNDWSRRDHDHAAWFFGKGAMRRWSGYGLGHRLVAGHLARHPGATAASLATVPADRFREDMRRLAQAEERAAAADGAGGPPAET